MPEIALAESDAPPLPTFGIAWDAANQRVLFQFDPAEFRTWGFIIGLLGMATASANELRAETLAQQQAPVDRQPIQDKDSGRRPGQSQP